MAVQQVKCCHDLLCIKPPKCGNYEQREVQKSVATKVLNQVGFTSFKIGLKPMPALPKLKKLYSKKFIIANNLSFHLNVTICQCRDENTAQQYASHSASICFLFFANENGMEKVFVRLKTEGLYFSVSAIT